VTRLFLFVRHDRPQAQNSAPRDPHRTAQERRHVFVEAEGHGFASSRVLTLTLSFALTVTLSFPLALALPIR
jgi:hypothetical protein